MMVLEIESEAHTADEMGRPPLGVKPTTIRLPVDVFDRIEAVAGKNRTASFIREAVVAELEKREKAKG
jgi:hypothetical protein